MSPLRRLLVAALALAGALVWGPPVVLAICLSGGHCGMHMQKKAEVPPCCRKAPEKGPSVASDHAACCGCCAKVHVGLAVDGGGMRVDTPVAPPVQAPSAVIAAPAAADGFVAPAAPLAPRPPPDRVLPLRI